jgi:hypothetical protein
MHIYIYTYKYTYIPFELIPREALLSLRGFFSTIDVYMVFNPTTENTGPIAADLSVHCALSMDSQDPADAKNYVKPFLKPSLLPADIEGSHILGTLYI